MNDPQADTFMLQQIMLMGFDSVAATNALIATNNVSIDAAIELIIAQPAPTFPRPPNPINPINPIPQQSPPPLVKPSPIYTPIKKEIPIQRDKGKEKEREKEKEKEKEIEKEKAKDKEKEKEKEKAKQAKTYDSDDDDEMEVYDDDDYGVDDDEEDAAIEQEAFEDIAASKSDMAVLDQSQLQETASKEIERIATITNTSISTAGALLRAFQWNSEKLLEKYYEDPDKVIRDAGVTLNATPTAKSGIRSSANSAKAKVVDCMICGDPLTNSNSCALECNHEFCKDCLAGYLRVQINEGKALEITCMAVKCLGRIPDTLITALVSSEDYTKYLNFVSKSFVEDNPNIKWCPRAGCGNAVKSDVKSITEAQCSCGYKFCFKCNGEAHAPAPCVMMKAWGKKCADDSETSHWISANTKDCPNCKSAIEKNGGCNHMSCRKCKHEFCWICFGNWKNHTSCNKYVEDGEKSLDRAALERYLHYFHRYHTHEQSKKFEQVLREAAVVKMVSIQNTDDSRWIDVQYIDSATEQLIECRRTLKYTYVFAFYLIPGPEKNLFEYLQGELEKTTEQLSGYLEAPLGTHTPRQIKDVTQLAAKRLQHLREGVDEMLETESKAPINPEVAAHKDTGTAASTKKPISSIDSPATSVNSKKKSKR